jgi:hypothetical protein
MFAGWISQLAVGRERESVSEREVAGRHKRKAFTKTYSVPHPLDHTGERSYQQLRTKWINEWVSVF